MKNIDHEQKKRQERIISLQLSIKNKEEALQRRMDRVKRQSEIAELAANENKDQNEIHARQNFMVQKLYCAFLKSKMELEMKKYFDVESSFQKIKTCTGNSDVQEIVHKFLTREQTYATLLTAVSEAEKKMEDNKNDYEQKSDELNNLKINLENKKDEKKENPNSTRESSY